TITAGGEQPLHLSAMEQFGSGLWNLVGNNPKSYHRAAANIRDPVGTGWVFGGFDSLGHPTDRCEVYDPKAGWRIAPRLNTACADAGETRIAGPIDVAPRWMIAAGTGTAGDLN